MNISDYYLDLEKVSNLKFEDERFRIHSYYNDLLIYASENERNDMAESIKNTLVSGGYLVKVVSENVEKINS